MTSERELTKRCLSCPVLLPVDYSRDLCPLCEQDAIEARAQRTDEWEELPTIGNYQSMFLGKRKERRS